ncbi:MAG TPA: ABC transporter substrate-binding protein [Streptosporangiaceae bacterium]
MWRARRHGTRIDLQAKPRSRARRKATAGGAVLVTLMLAAAGCGANTKATAGGSPVNGGAVTYALPANVTPSEIFPFTPGGFFTIVNTDNLQYLMYRPLYWWGAKGSPYLNEGMSLALPPTYHGQTVTITLKKGWKWSNGAPITAKDIMFWMNMMKAEAKHNWGGYVPGGIPDNVTNVRAINASQVQMTVTKKFSPLWFTADELSQITPMPQAWDISSANTKSDCADNVSDCAAVFNYLTTLGQNKKTWTTSPLWKVVDGAWQLTGYSTDGTLTFNYNPKYSGHVPADHVTQFTEVPFTSEQAEFNVLQAGGQNELDVGYLPTVNAPEPPPGAAVGQNPVAGYTMKPVYTWGLNYIPYNFSKSDAQLAVISQVYIRQALQLLINQSAIVQGALHGYGKITSGVVGDAPPTKYLSPEALKGDPYPFSIQRARALLTEHGWTIHAGNQTVCTNPGASSTECGPGVKAGTRLNLTMLYASGNAWVEAAMLQLKTNAAQVGIQIGLTAQSFDNVLNWIENGVKSCPASGCPWELANWGEGWSYVPDYLPTGDELFETGSAGNLGHYHNARDDQLIKASVETSSAKASLQAMYKWEEYLVNQVPVMYEPEAPAALVETVDNLQIGPLNPTLALAPETWFFTR